MNNMLQQVGLGYINVTLIPDTTNVRFSTRYGMNLIDAISLDIKTYALAQDIVKKQIKEGMSDLQKIIIIYDYIVTNTKYDYKSSKDMEHIKIEPQTAYGCLNDHLAICSGYALGLKALFKAAGIEVYTITGTSNKTEHMWNIVKINHKFYNLDATFDSISTNSLGKANYSHFMISDEDLSKDHKWDQDFVARLDQQNYVNVAYQNSRFFGGLEITPKRLYDQPYQVMKPNVINPSR